MAASQALSDDQVAGELRKMVEFIKKEADEKAKEIELKANEEYEIEKANIVRSECAAIDAQYDRKYKQASLAQQIARSGVANKTRLKVLGAREDVFNEIFEETAKQLKNIATNASSYQTLLEGLIEEGLYALMDESIALQVRQVDVDIATKAYPQAVKLYKEKSGKDVKVEIDQKNYIPADSTGGVIIVGGNGKIDVNNTLEERLKLLSEESLPAIRLAVFGPSATRKFFD